MTDPKRVYSDEEVKSILSRAIDRQRTSSPEGGLSHDDLLAVARDAGISVSAIEAAAAEVTANRGLEADELAVRKERASAFRVHLFTYIPVIAFLAFVNAMTTPYPWVLWPAGGWALALILHARFAIFASEVEIARAAKRRSERRRRREERAQRRAKRSELQEGARQLGHAVERGVAVILTETAKRIHEEIAAVPETRGNRVRVGDPKARPEEDEDDRDARGARGRTDDERRSRRR